MPDQPTDDDFQEIEAALRKAAHQNQSEIPPPKQQESSPEIDISQLSEEELAMRQAQIEERLQAAVAGSSLHKLDGESEGDETFSFDAELDEKLRQIESVSARAKSRQSTRLNEDKTRKKQERDAAAGLGVGITIAYTFIGLPILGFFVGMLLEPVLHIPNARNGGALLGIGLGFLMMMIQISRYSKRQ